MEIISGPFRTIFFRPDKERESLHQDPDASSETEKPFANFIMSSILKTPLRGRGPPAPSYASTLTQSPCRASSCPGLFCKVGSPPLGGGGGWVDTSTPLLPRGWGVSPGSLRIPRRRQFCYKCLAIYFFDPTPPPGLRKKPAPVPPTSRRLPTRRPPHG